MRANEASQTGLAAECRRPHQTLDAVRLRMHRRDEPAGFNCFGAWSAHSLQVACRKGSFVSWHGAARRGGPAFLCLCKEK